MMRAILRSMLRGEYYNVVGEATNGQAAIDLVRTLKPDLVCMDVVMPEKNGIEALIEIKAANPGTEVIMISYRSSTVLIKWLWPKMMLHPSGNSSLSILMFIVILLWPD